MGTQKKVENTPEWALGVRARCRLEPHLKEASWVGALSKAKHQKYFSTTPSRVLSRGLETEKPSIKHREGKEVSIVPSSPQTEGKWHCVSNGAFTTMASCGFHRGDEDKCTSVNLPSPPPSTQYSSCQLTYPSFPTGGEVARDCCLAAGPA